MLPKPADIPLSVLRDKANSGVNQVVSLQLDPSTTNTGASLSYEATGLPDGLTISPNGLQ